MKKEKGEGRRRRKEEGGPIFIASRNRSYRKRWRGRDGMGGEKVSQAVRQDGWSIVVRSLPLSLFSSRSWRTKSLSCQLFYGLLFRVRSPLCLPELLGCSFVLSGMARFTGFNLLLSPSFAPAAVNSTVEKERDGSRLEKGDAKPIDSSLSHTQQTGENGECAST